MRKTYAYNSIIVGVLLGLLVYITSENLVLGILACIGISVVGFVVIRALEKAARKGVDKAVDATTKAYRKHKENKEKNENNQ